PGQCHHWLLQALSCSPSCRGRFFLSILLLLRRLSLPSLRLLCSMYSYWMILRDQAVSCRKKGRKAPFPCTNGTTLLAAGFFRPGCGFNLRFGFGRCFRFGFGAGFGALAFIGTLFVGLTGFSKFFLATGC